MNTSPSVAAAAIALMLASLIVLAGEAIQVAGAFQILGNTGKSLSAFLSARPGVLLVLPIGFSLMGLVSSVGLLRSREWGRRATLFLATAPVTIYSLLVYFQPVSIFGQHRGPGSFNLALPACIYALALFVPLSLWWLILLTREQVRCRFR